MPHSTEGSARERLLDAILAITAERGLDQVSVREVATAARVSIGTVQYYCRSKDEMLRIAFEESSRRILERALAIRRVGLVGTVLRRALLEFLPLDERRTVEAKVYLAFAARAAVSADLAEVQHRLMQQQRTLCADAFRLAKERGQALDAYRPDDAARVTVAVVDGLLLELLSDPDGLGADDAVAVLDRHLRRYLRVGGS